jgi:hypothetical protein
MQSVLGLKRGRLEGELPEGGRPIFDMGVAAPPGLLELPELFKPSLCKPGETRCKIAPFVKPFRLLEISPLLSLAGPSGGRRKPLRAVGEEVSHGDREDEPGGAGAVDHQGRLRPGRKALAAEPPVRGRLPWPAPRLSPGERNQPGSDQGVRHRQARDDSKPRRTLEHESEPSPRWPRGVAPGERMPNSPAREYPVRSGASIGSAPTGPGPAIEKRLRH